MPHHVRRRKAPPGTDEQGVVAVAQDAGFNLEARQARLHEITQQVFQLPDPAVGHEVAQPHQLLRHAGFGAHSKHDVTPVRVGQRRHVAQELNLLLIRRDLQVLLEL